MKIKLIITFVSFCFGISSMDVLEMLDDSVLWKLKKNEGQTKIYSCESDKNNLKIIKIEQEIEYTNEQIFDVIQNIDNYNNIISNSSLYSKLIKAHNDTLWGYQLVKNSIPFTRDRQYVFKMYKLSQNKLVWIIDEQFNNDKKNTKDIRTLEVGAGVWEIKNMNNNRLLINKIYVDDKVNMPGLFLDRSRRNHVHQIFKDVLNNVKNN